MILEYKMDRVNGVLVTPQWIECGGFMPKHSDFTFVGFSPSVREYKIPSTALVLTEQECADRLISIHAESPFIDVNGNEMSNEDVSALASLTISANDIE